MVRMRLVLLGLIAASFSVASPVRAQLSVRIGVGPGVSRFSIPNDHSTTFGPFASGSMSLGKDYVGFAADVMFQPFLADHPRRDESFRSLFILPGMETRFGNTRVRFGLGLAEFWYKGSEVASSMRTGPAAGLAIGQRVTGHWVIDGAMRIGASTSETTSFVYTLQLNRAVR